MTPVLDRARQLLVAAETTAGTEIDLTSDPGHHLVRNCKEISFNPSVNGYDRALQQGTLTGLGLLKGSRSATISAMYELGGDPLGVDALRPKWHDVVGACGLAPRSTFQILLDAPSPAGFARGALLGNNTDLNAATKLIRCVHYHDGGAGARRLWYVTVSGDPLDDTDTLFDDADTQNSADVESGAAPASAGFRWTPVSETETSAPATVTAELREGPTRGTIVGARGTGTVTLRHNEPPMMQAELTGPMVLENNTLRDGTAVPPSQGGLFTPDVCLAARALLLDPGGNALDLVREGAEYQFNNTVALRPTIGDSLAGSGFRETSITERNPSVSFDPEREPDRFDSVLSAGTGSTLRVYQMIGALSGAGANGIIAIEAPKTQIEGDLSRGERNAIQTENLTLRCFGDGDDELIVDHFKAV